MTAHTHKQFSICFAFIGAMLLNLGAVTQINYYLTIPIMVMASKWGALMPDVDHNWNNVKEKTVPNWILNKLIHLTGGKHRSWQTHSIDICLAFTATSYLLPRMLYVSEIISNVDKEVMMILMIGVSTGWISHLFSDSLTADGVRVLFHNKKKVRIVPKKIGKLKFNTGGEWEEFNYTVMDMVNNVLGVMALIFPFREDIIDFIIRFIQSG